VLDQRLWVISPAEPPAGHRIGLGEAVDDDGALGHPRERSDRRRRLTVSNPPIDLVGHHPKIVPLGEDGQPLQIRHGYRGAGWIGRGIEDDEPGLARDRGLDLVEIEGAPAGQVGADRHRHAAAEAHHRGVDRKARVGEDHLVARRDGGQDAVEDVRLGARRDQDLLGAGADAAVEQLRRDRLAQGRQSSRRTIAGLPVFECADARLDDVLRRGKVGLADLEVEDAAAARLERTGAQEDVERGLGP